MQCQNVSLHFQEHLKTFKLKPFTRTTLTTWMFGEFWVKFLGDRFAMSLEVAMGVSLTGLSWSSNYQKKGKNSFK